MKVTCDRCGGESISQSASLMIDLQDYKEMDFVLDWDDLQFEDFFYCKAGSVCLSKHGRTWAVIPLAVFRST